MQARRVVSREEWIAARQEHLAREKEFTRLRDQLSRERRDLPWVRVGKTYVFDGPSGRETLADLFEGRSQLIVQHFMFDPSWDEGCVAARGALTHAFFQRQIRETQVGHELLQALILLPQRADLRRRGVPEAVAPHPRLARLREVLQPGVMAALRPERLTPAPLNRWGPAGPPPAPRSGGRARSARPARGA